MGSLLIAVLPLALGAAVSPVLLALQLLVLSGGSSRRLARAWALTLGAALVLGGFSLLCVTALQQIRPHHADHKSATDAAVLFASSGLLVLLAIRRTLVRRPTADEQHSTRITQRLATAPVSWFVGVGAVGMLVNFSTLVLVLPAVHEITRSTVATAGKAATFSVLVVVVLLPVLVPVLLVTVLGSGADRLLGSTHTWVERNSRTIGTVIEVVFAVYLVVKGVKALP